MTLLKPNSAEIDLSSAFAAAWQLVQTSEASNEPVYSDSFVSVLLNNLRDGVIFVDLNRGIKLWNRTVELMTDIGAARMLGNQLTPQLLSMRDVHGNEIQMADCPLEQCLQTGEALKGEYRIAGRSGREIKVDTNFVPVFNHEQIVDGVVVILHDASLQTDLTRQIKDLFAFSIVDPLTQVHNRAEFERVLDQFIKAKSTTDFKCSLVVCDIDFFKSVNDNYNHHVGDQCLVAFADVLRTFVRSNDLVARYGGEEFVILCGDCELPLAAKRAEEIRQTLNRTAMPMLGGKCITASFGVAELNVNESATNFFVRADSALLKAKEAGRNCVVESQGSNLCNDEKTVDRLNHSVTGLTWKYPAPANPLLLEEFLTSTPITMLVEKLRGYILENNAKIISVSTDFAKVQIEVDDPRTSKHKGNFIVEFEFQEGTPVALPENERRRRTASPRNYIRIAICESKKKWFGRICNDLVEVAMRDLRRYFMISDETAKLKIERAVTKSTRDQP